MIEIYFTVWALLAAIANGYWAALDHRGHGLVIAILIGVAFTVAPMFWPLAILPCVCFSVVWLIRRKTSHLRPASPPATPAEQSHNHRA